METKTALGVEGGGTKTEWLVLRVLEQETYVTAQGVLPPGNFRLISPQQLDHLLHSLPKDVTDCGIFLAGCVTDEDRRTLRSIAQQVWPSASLVVGSDRESGFAAAFGSADGIAVISGTGSAVTGRKNGLVEHAGGRGHLLGDRGGGYVICMEGLRLALRSYDLQHQTTPLANSILRALQLTQMEDLIAWTQTADKMQISQLAPYLFAAAEEGDDEMLSIIAAGAKSLAEYTESVARWLDFKNPPIKLSGGLFLHQPIYAQLFRKSLTELIATTSVEVSTTPGSLGAALIASGEVPPLWQRPSARPTDTNAHSGIAALRNASTEAANPKSERLDHLATSELVQLFVEEEETVMAALRAAQSGLEAAVDLTYNALLNGGRLFYVGAGTSGRLGVLDASEIPPTFGEAPERVQGIIAGGVEALYRSVEGAEDSLSDGAKSITDKGVTDKDIVCGITASGRTPFVLGALTKAKQIGASTLLITSNQITEAAIADVVVTLQTGAELITGSTRLKAGSATKMALNILSSCAMIKIGKVKGNMMIDLRASNEKLKDRAIRIVSALRGCSYDSAREFLVRAGWSIRDALRQE